MSLAPQPVVIILEGFAMAMKSCAWIRYFVGRGYLWVWCDSAVCGCGGATCGYGVIRLFVDVAEGMGVPV